MSKENIVEIAGKVCNLLQPLESLDRQRVIQASLVLLGEPTTLSIPQGGSPSRLMQPIGAPTATNNLNVGDAYQYFQQKDPHNKIECFAVAARFLEQHQSAVTCSKDELKSVIGTKGARRNFDEKNFQRDIDNARTKGLFNRGADEKGQFTLSYYGQQYVDALPDRAKAKALRKPKKANRKSATKSKSESKGKA
jgi:hypothetical protein